MLKIMLNEEDIQALLQFGMLEFVQDDKVVAVVGLQRNIFNDSGKEAR